MSRSRRRPSICISTASPPTPTRPRSRSRYSVRSTAGRAVPASFQRSERDGARARRVRFSAWTYHVSLGGIPARTSRKARLISKSGFLRLMVFSLTPRKGGASYVWHESGHIPGHVVSGRVGVVQYYESSLGAGGLGSGRAHARTPAAHR